MNYENDKYLFDCVIHSTTVIFLYFFVSCIHSHGKNGDVYKIIAHSINARYLLLTVVPWYRPSDVQYFNLLITVVLGYPWTLGGILLWI